VVGGVVVVVTVRFGGDEVKTIGDVATLDRRPVEVLSLPRRPPVRCVVGTAKVGRDVVVGGRGRDVAEWCTVLAGGTVFGVVDRYTVERCTVVSGGLALVVVGTFWAAVDAGCPGGVVTTDPALVGATAAGREPRPAP
jgi:hypothetical protein